jgi:two-component system, cell cycle response regulator DivK
MSAESDSGPKVLVIDDNEQILQICADVLEFHGYQPVTLQDGRKVIETMRGIRPAAVLLDMRLPDISGFDLIKAIKADAELSSVPVIAMTGIAMRGDRLRILNAGCDDYLSKPFWAADLIAALERHVPHKAAA